MRTDWIKNTLLSLGPGKQFCHVLSTLISALGWLWRLYSMWQRRAGDSFSWHPGTHHTDTLLWSATLILIKHCLTRAHEDQGCWGGADASINTRLNEGRQWWRRWCGGAGGTSCPQALGWVRCHRHSRGHSSRDCILITRYTLSSWWVTALVGVSVQTCLFSDLLYLWLHVYNEILP